MKTLTGILPLALVLVVVSGLVWWLLGQGSGTAPWLVGAVLFAHGWVHLVFLLPVEEGGENNPFDMRASWLVEQGMSVGLARGVGTVLAVTTFLAFLAGALATVGWLVPTAWWAECVVAGVVGSTLLLVLFFSPMLLLGFAINAGLVLLVAQTAYVVPR